MVYLDDKRKDQNLHTNTSYKNRRLTVGGAALKSRASLKKSFSFSFKIRPLFSSNTGRNFGRLYPRNWDSLASSSWVHYYKTPRR